MFGFELGATFFDRIYRMDRMVRREVRVWVGEWESGVAAALCRHRPHQGQSGRSGWQATAGKGLARPTLPAPVRVGCGFRGSPLKPEPFTLKPRPN